MSNSERRNSQKLGKGRAPFSTIHFANFLSPILQEAYEYIASYVGNCVGHPTILGVGQSPQEFSAGQVDVGFICGLTYIHMTNWSDCPVELLAAPVLCGERYQRKPIYFSDVVVHRDSPYTSLGDLRGCVWAYNEYTSHSGYNLVYYSLLERGETLPFFGKTIETGSHLDSLRMVIDEQADVTAVDSHMLDVVLQTDAEAARQLRVIDTLGSSTVPPVVVAKSVDAELKRQIQEALVTLHYDNHAVSQLHKGSIERFVPITNEHYQDIRDMFLRVQTAELSFR
ncbi:MAG TPA: PhnD/SsuA/transferrin family substrate-binding protein [Ktedonobacteraceae bacterium]